MPPMRKTNTIIISLLLSLWGPSWAEPVEAARVTAAGEKPVLQQLTEKASGIIDYALSLTGVPYKFGGNDPEKGLDCSGFVKNVFREAAGLSLPHNALAISLVGDKIQPGELQPGDLVFFKTMRRAFSHVGIYLGDNKFVHAATRGGEVMVSDLREKYWTRRFNGARRIEASDAPGKISLGPAAGVSE
jgi:cell wall-associated NlpC family hydrolase